MAAKRTPFGRMGGALKDVHPSDLLAVAAKDALKAGNIAPSIIDTANIGQVNNVSICRKKDHIHSVQMCFILIYSVDNQVKQSAQRSVVQELAIHFYVPTQQYFQKVFFV